MIKQPKDSKLCGHSCIATLLNISLQDSVRHIGHKNKTKGKELIKLLDNNFIVSKNKRGLPTEFSLCMIRNNNIKNWGHWVLYDRGYFYDPIYGKYLTQEEFFNNYPEETRITSHWVLNKKAHL